MRLSLIAALTTAILVSPAAIRAEVAAACPAHVLRWIEHCRAGTDLDLEPVACPRGILRLRLHPDGGEPLDVEVNSEPQRAFRAVGRLGISPILEVASFSEVPESRRQALEVFAEWVEEHGQGLILSAITPPSRAPEPAVPDRLKRPLWLSLTLAALTLMLVLLYLLRGRHEAPQAEHQETPLERSTPRALWSRVLWACAVFLGAQITGLLRAPASVSLHVDTVRDLLILKEWVEGPTSISLGSVSSAGFYHGFLWHRLLAAWQSADPSLSSINVAISTAMSLSVLLLYLFVEARTSRPIGLIAAGAAIVAFLWTDSLFTPLWQPTLSPELSCLIVGVAALARRPGLRRRGAVVLTAISISLASQVHLVFLLLLPGLLIACRRDLVILLPATAGLVFVAWDLLSHDALGVNLAMLSSGYCLDAIAGSAHSIQFDWRAVSIIILAIAACALALVDRARGWPPEKASWLSTLNAMLGTYVVCGLVLFGPRVLVPRYWTTALVIAIASLAATSHHLVLRQRMSNRSWIGVAVFVASLVAVASLGRIHNDVMTLEDLDHVADALEREGLPAEEAFRAVNAAAPLAGAFERGIWLRASCQQSARRLALREVHRHLLLLVEGQGRQLPELPDLRLIESRDRRFGLLPYYPYLNTSSYRVCLRGENRCYPSDRSFPNVGWNQMCFVGDWGSMIDMPLARETREVDIEFEVSIPARGSDHVLFLPSLDGRYGRAECRGVVVGVEGVQIQRWESGLRLRGSETAQQGSLRIRWPWHDALCHSGKHQRPMPLVELETGPFVRLRPFLEASP